MRRIRAPRLAACLALGVLTTTVATGVSTADTADAASGRWISYSGKSIDLASIPATTVELTAYSPSSSRMVEFVLDRRVVGVDTDVERVGNRWVATAQVDLTGSVGQTRLRTRYVTEHSGTHRVDHWIRAIAPAPAGFTPAAPTTPGTSSAPVRPEQRPGPDSTGVPVERPLTPSGPLTLYRSGEVIDGLDVDGCVQVFASDVTIRNSRIRCHGKKYQPVVTVEDGAARTTLEDVEIDGLGTSQVCVGWGRYTLRRADVHGCADGARLGSDVVIENSWIHDMARVRPAHSDAIQTTSGKNVIIRRNTLDVNNYARGWRHNASIMIGSELGSQEVRDFLVEGNYITGGGFSINVRNDVNASNLVIRNNVFGTATLFGQVIAPSWLGLTDGNVLEGTGTPVRAVKAG